MNNYRRAYTIIGIIIFLGILHFIIFQTPGFSNELIETQQIDNTTVLVETNSGALEGLNKFFSYTGFRNATPGHFIMIFVGLIFIFLAIKYDYEPLLLIPIGTGVIIGNIPFFQDGGINLQLGIYQKGSVLNYLYYGVVKGIYPPLIFLGIGAMTDFSSLISNPRLMLLGAAAQVGIFLHLLVRFTWVLICLKPGQ